MTFGCGLYFTFFLTLLALTEGRIFPKEFFTFPSHLRPRSREGTELCIRMAWIRDQPETGPTPCCVRAPLPSNLGKAGWANGCTVLYLLTALVVKRGTANDSAPWLVWRSAFCFFWRNDIPL
ncbi:hypothetical protein B9Z19DRAFT_345182 [Tuber borchii]|uniref:Secreted protein n=1 Tax=Tuber borchii TaxID=42251 RepID=A0A2T6ZJ12_TUBBO|nr:hypothetical protein B9Z19DRAFT_345182 [Tuber borchii]